MTHLKVGDKAPTIKSIDQDGQSISLADYKGKKVILFFYPNDNTPTCTTEACNFRDNYKMLKKEGFEVIGVSINGQKSHRKFADKYNLPFRLIVDEDKKIVNDYGVYGEKQFMGRTIIGTYRTTFIINEKGKIDHIIEKVVSKKAAEQILESVKTPL